MDSTHLASGDDYDAQIEDCAQGNARGQQKVLKGHYLHRCVILKMRQRETAGSNYFVGGVCPESK